MENTLHLFLRCILYSAIGYTLLVLLLFVLQRSLIYFPEKHKLSAEKLHAYNLIYWPSPTDFLGLMSANQLESSRGTIIVFHGNAGAAYHRSYYIDSLEPLGFRVILAEYPGYGGREGEPGEKAFFKDARQLIRAAHSDFPGPLYLVGESMGCGVVAAMVKENAFPIHGALLITPWDSLSRLAQAHYWYLPARWLVRDRFDNVAHLTGYTGPIAIAVADQDTVIPTKHTMALYDSLPGPKKLIRFQQSGHNNWPSHPQAPWWQEAMIFISSNGKERHGPVDSVTANSVGSDSQ